MMPMVEISTLLFTWNDFVPEENFVVDLLELEVETYEILGDKLDISYSPSDSVINKILSSL